MDGEQESSEDEYQTAVGDFLTPERLDAVDEEPTDIVAITPEQVQDLARRLIFHEDEQSCQYSVTPSRTARKI